VKIIELEETVFDLRMYLSNEEKQVLDRVEGIMPIESYTERDRVIIENLIRKSLVIKVPRQGSYVVLKNE